MAGIKKRLGSLLGPRGKPGTDAANVRFDEIEGKADNAVTRIGHIETVAGLAPGEVTDAQTANLIAQPASQTRASLADTTAHDLTSPTDVARTIERSNIPILQSTKASLARLENRAKQNPIRVHRLVNVTDDPDPAAYAGMTTTRDTIDGKPAWKLEGSINRLNLSLGARHVGPVSAVSAWVYVTDPAVTSLVGITIQGEDGNWNRTHTGTGSNFENLEDKSLKQGWNLIRFRAAATNSWRNLHNPTGVNVQFTVSGTTTNYVHSVDLEIREKATVLIVCDWGSKPFLDNAYPDMKERGWPVIWAPRSERFGEATYPDDMASIAEVKALMAENNNEVSYHSPRGQATSGLSPAETRQEVIDALVGLKVHGVYTDGALWRAAWVQNNAPNAWATRDLMVASATPNDKYYSTPWPPLDRYDIPRSGGIRGWLDSNTLDVLKGTHGFDVFYTHGVLPDADHSPGNHASQSEWDAFVADLEQAEAEGWLEVLNFGQLLEKYPLERHLDEQVALVDGRVRDPDTVVTPILTGLDHTTPSVFGGQTVTHVSDMGGQPAWRLEADGTGGSRVTAPVDPPVTPPNPVTVTLRVHVSGTQPIDQVMLSIRGADGSWVRSTGQTGLLDGWPLVNGWNEIRWNATASPVSLLAGIDSVNVQFTISGSTVVHVGAVTVEGIE